MSYSKRIAVLGLDSVRSVARVHCRPFSGKKNDGIMDTLGLSKSLEAEGGFTPKQAEAITRVMNQSLQEISQSFLSKTENQKKEHTEKLSAITDNFQVIQDLKLAMLKSDLESFKESRLTRLEHKSEMQQKNLEKIIVDSFAKNADNLEKDFQQLKAGLEGAKYEMMKYVIGTLFSVAAAQIAIFRLMY